MEPRRPRAWRPPPWIYGDQTNRERRRARRMQELRRADHESSYFSDHLPKQAACRYLRFHQTPTPTITTAKGRRNWLTARTQLSCRVVMVIRRSSGAFGRMEIRSSSDESQLMVF